MEDADDRPTNGPTTRGEPPTSNRVATLCRSCVTDTGVDGGGVSLLTIDGTPVMMHASDRVSAVIEELQFTLGEGPCIEASALRRAVQVPDLSDPHEALVRRWPGFALEAHEAGALAIFAFPIMVGMVGLGTLDLYRRTAGPLSPTQLGYAEATVRAVGSILVDAGAPRQNENERYSMTVHQAAGMVMVQLGSRIDVALVRLRGTAFAEGRPVSDVAADVVAGLRTFRTESP